MMVLASSIQPLPPFSHPLDTMASIPSSLHNFFTKFISFLVSFVKLFIATTGVYPNVFKFSIWVFKFAKPFSMAMRFSLSRFTTEEEIDFVIEKMPEIMDKLTKLSPFQKELAELRG